jgi:hypothetical protein
MRKKAGTAADRPRLRSRRLDQICTYREGDNPMGYWEKLSIDRSISKSIFRSIPLIKNNEYVCFSYSICQDFFSFILTI